METEVFAIGSFVILSSTKPVTICLHSKGVNSNVLLVERSLSFEVLNSTVSEE